MDFVISFISIVSFIILIKVKCPIIRSHSLGFRVSEECLHSKAEAPNIRKNISVIQYSETGEIVSVPRNFQTWTTHVQNAILELCRVSHLLEFP